MVLSGVNLPRNAGVREECGVISLALLRDVELAPARMGCSLARRRCRAARAFCSRPIQLALLLRALPVAAAAACARDCCGRPGVATAARRGPHAPGAALSRLVGVGCEAVS